MFVLRHLLSPKTGAGGCSEFADNCVFIADTLLHAFRERCVILPKPRRRRVISDISKSEKDLEKKMISRLLEGGVDFGEASGIWTAETMASYIVKAYTVGVVARNSRTTTYQILSGHLNISYKDAGKIIDAVWDLLS